MADDYKDGMSELDTKANTLSGNSLAEEAVKIATRQLMASSEFKKPRMARLARYWELYDGKTAKKLRQLFNVAIPVFPGMVDTLNAEYDTPITLEFREGDPSDYFKVQKIDAAFKMEIMNTSENSKWDSKLSLVRRHAIMNGVAIPKLIASSDPEYKSEFDVVNLKWFHFQPKGGNSLENHLFAGEENIRKTQSELLSGAKSGDYNVAQVKKLIASSADPDHLPDNDNTSADKLSRFKPLGLNPDNNSYVGLPVYQLAHFILEIRGQRYYLCWHPWTKTWLRFDKWSEITSSDLYPWNPYQTHPDDENFLSKSYSDDLYPAADSIVAMFNQELTNREKKNYGARAYDKDMFTDVRKLDEAMFRPDALVPVDTKGGTRRISEGIFSFDTGELQGTVNLIDWVTDNLGRNTGATELSQGQVQDASKKASVTFAEQRAVTKRVSWASQPFQTMMAGLGKRYLYGLKDHMPSKMAIRLLGENGWDWDQITRLDLNTSKDVDVLITSTDQQQQKDEMRAQKRKEVLLAIQADPTAPQRINMKKVDEELFRLADFEDQDIAELLDTQTYDDKKSYAKAAEAIQLILQGRKPDLWYGATVAFIQKIKDFATDKRSTLKDKFQIMLNYAMAHVDIVKQNMQRDVAEQARMQLQQQTFAPPQPTDTPTKPTPANPGVPGGMSRAMSVGAANS